MSDDTPERQLADYLDRLIAKWRSFADALDAEARILGSGDPLYRKFLERADTYRDCATALEHELK